MSKKMRAKETPDISKFVLSLRSMSFADLYAMYTFVAADFNRQFGTKIEAKKLIHERYKIILEELNSRAYGKNPYEVSKIEIDGENPEDIDLNLFENKSNCGPNEPQKY